MSLKDDNDARRAGYGITGGRRYSGGSSGGRTEWDRISRDPLGYITSGRGERSIGNAADTLGELRGFGDRSDTRYQTRRGQAERAEGSADRAEVRRREGARTLRDERDYDRGYADGARGYDGRDEGRSSQGNRDYYRDEGDIRREAGPRYDDRDDDRLRGGRYTDAGSGRVAGVADGDRARVTSAALRAAILEYHDIMEMEIYTPAERDRSIDQYFDAMDRLRGSDGLIHIERDITVNIEGGIRVTIPGRREGYREDELRREFGRDLGADRSVDDAITVRAAALEAEDRARGGRDGERDRDGRGDSRDGDDRGDTRRSNAPEEPVTRLEGGSGTISFNDDRYKNGSNIDRIKFLVNSETVTGLDGQPVSNGQRVNAAMALITQEMRGIQPGAAGMTQAALAMEPLKDPAFARNMEALYRSSTDEERVAIRAQMEGAIAEAKRIDPNMEAPLRAAMAQLTAADRDGPSGGRDGDSAQTDADKAARLEALGNIHFSDPEKEALWQTKLQQERALQNPVGGPFGAFFMQLFTMIGNMLSGKGDLNQSAESFLTANHTLITPETVGLADNVIAGRIPPATGTPAPAAGTPAPGTPAPGTPAPGSAVAPPPPPPPPGSPASVLDMNFISNEVTANEARLAAEEATRKGQAAPASTPTYTQLSTTAYVNVSPESQVAMKGRLQAMGFDVGPVTGGTDLTKVENSIKQLETMIGRTGAAVDGKLDPQLVAIMKDPEAMAAIQAARAAGAASAPGGSGTTPPPTPAPAPAAAPGRQP